MKKFLSTLIVLALIGGGIFYAYKAGYITAFWDGVVDYSDSVNPATITKEMYESYLEDGKKMEYV